MGSELWSLSFKNTVTTQQLRRNGGVLLLLLIARVAVDSFDLVGCMQEDLIGS